MACLPERAGEILRFTRGYMADAPDDLGTAVAFISAPPEPFVAGEPLGGAISRVDSAISTLFRCHVTATAACRGVAPHANDRLSTLIGRWVAIGVALAPRPSPSSVPTARVACSC